MRHLSCRTLWIALVASLCVALPSTAAEQVGTVSVTNAVGDIQPDGSFVVRNASIGWSVYSYHIAVIIVLSVHETPLEPWVVRARLGSGSTNLFSAPFRMAIGTVHVPPPWSGSRDAEAPKEIAITAPASESAAGGGILSGGSIRLSASARFDDGRITDISTDAGVEYYSSNHAVARVSADGMVTAGEVMRDTIVYVTVAYRGTFARHLLVVRPSANPDPDGDGIPTWWERLHRLDPADSSDGNSDADRDGLVARLEFALRTNPLDPDTDHDGLLDGADPEPLIPERVPPLVAIVAPAPGTTLTPGGIVVVRVAAEDNARVRRIIVRVGGVQVASADGGTCEVGVSVPDAAGLVVEAVAQDVAGNNASVAQTFAIVRDDGLAVLTGRVIDAGGAPVADALVTLAGGAGSVRTAADGRFRLSHRPGGSTATDLVAIADGGGRRQAVAVMATSAPGAERDLGDLLLTSVPFEAVLGQRHQIDLGGSVEHALPFAFLFYGRQQASLHVNAHGSITFGAPDGRAFAIWADYGDSDAAIVAPLVEGPPRIAPCWSFINASAWAYYEVYGNLVPQPNPDPTVGVYIADHADRIVITWLGVRHSTDHTGENSSFQAVLHRDGAIAFAYCLPQAGSASYLTRTLVGLAPGGGGTAQAVDWVQGDGAAIPGAAYELFDSVLPAFDLGLCGLRFTPRTEGGYAVAVERFQDLADRTLLAGRIEGGDDGSAVAIAAAEQYPLDALGGFAGRIVRRPIRVDPAAIGRADGSSWTDAYTDLQTALDAARSGDEVWVREGTYLAPDDGFSIARQGDAPPVRLYGGFAGNETRREQRDPWARPTILSGERGTPSSDDNVSFVISLNDAMLSGFTVTRAAYLGVSGWGFEMSECRIIGNGTGVAAFGQASIRRSVIAGNRGVGIAFQYPSLDRVAIDDVVVAGNARGGIASGQPLDIRHATFVGNSGGAGSAIRLSGPGSSRVANAIVWANPTGDPLATAITASPGSIEVVGSCVEGGFPGVGNTFTNPLFVDLDRPAGADGVWGTDDDGLQLTAASDLIDAGRLDDGTDADVRLRSRTGAGTGPDLGAYERGGTPLVLPGPSLPPLDRGRRVEPSVVGASPRTLPTSGLFPFVVNVLGDDLAAPTEPDGVGRVPRLRLERARAATGR